VVIDAYALTLAAACWRGVAGLMQSERCIARAQDLHRREPDFASRLVRVGDSQNYPTYSGTEEGVTMSRCDGNRITSELVNPDLP